MSTPISSRRTRELIVDVNRDLASSHGSHGRSGPADALQRLRRAPDFDHLSAPTNDYQVILEVEPQYQRNPSDLSKLYLRNAATGAWFRSSAVAHLRTELGPVLINHQGQLPAVTISFNLAPGVSLGQRSRKSTQLEREHEPAGHGGDGLPGHRAGVPGSLKGQGMLLIAAVLVIYMVLGILYESFIHPITILSGLPAAGARRAADADAVRAWTSTSLPSSAS